MHQNQDDTNSNNISNWIHKRYTHNCYLDQKLYERDKFNQVYEISLLLEQDSDDLLTDSDAQHSFFKSTRPKIWSFTHENGVRTSHMIRTDRDVVWIEI